MLSTRSVGQRRTVGSRGQQKARRTIMEIYHDILMGIERESRANGLVKRTRVQQYSGLSYDKFSRHLSDMATKGLVTLSPLAITEKGRAFVREYGRIRLFMREIGARFFQTETPVRQVAMDLVEGIPEMSHSVLLYEDRNYADVVAADYIARGLEEGESCVYLTTEDPEFVERMLVDLDTSFEKNIRENRLRIYRGRAKTPEKPISLDQMKRLVQDSTKGMKPPYRIFGNFGHLISRSKGPYSLLPVEKQFHERFAALGITLLCWHNLDKVLPSNRRRFVEAIVEHHNYVVFASEPSKAFAFDTTLLRTEA